MGPGRLNRKRMPWDPTCLNRKDRPPPEPHERARPTTPRRGKGRRLEGTNTKTPLDATKRKRPLETTKHKKILGSPPSEKTLGDNQELKRTPTQKPWRKPSQKHPAWGKKEPFRRDQVPEWRRAGCEAGQSPGQL